MHVYLLVFLLTGESFRVSPVVALPFLRMTGALSECLPSAWRRNGAFGSGLDLTILSCLCYVFVGLEQELTIL